MMGYDRVKAFEHALQASELKLIRAYTQRDLEDQIKEDSEQYYKNLNNKQMSQSGATTPLQQEKKTVSLKEVRDLLKQGYTRYKKSDKGYGSIEEKFGLSTEKLKEVLAHPKIKRLKTVFPGPVVEIVDDIPEDDLEIVDDVSEDETFN